MSTHAHEFAVNTPLQAEIAAKTIYEYFNKYRLGALHSMTLDVGRLKLSVWVYPRFTYFYSMTARFKVNNVKWDTPFKWLESPNKEEILRAVNKSLSNLSDKEAESKTK